MDRASRNLGSGGSNNSLNNLCHWSTVQQAVEYKDTAIGTLVNSNFSKDNPRALKRKWVAMAGVEGPENPLLTLGLGRSPSSSENSKVSSPTACIMSPSSVKETDEESSMDLGLNFDLCLGHDVVHHHKKPNAGAEHGPSDPKLDLQLSLSTCSPESAVTNASTASLDVHDGLETLVPISVTDTSGRKSEPSSWVFGHYMASSSYASEATYSFSLAEIPQKVDDAVPSPDVSSAITASVKSPAACTSGATNPLKRNTNTKCCQFPGCEKGARGASGYCIAHGGGRRCQKPGCQKGAEGRTIYCKAHGGGRRCQYLGCTKSAEGRTDHCIAHGGGRRCSEEGCSRAARGKSGLCIKHGGGKRCQRENCKRHPPAAPSCSRPLRSNGPHQANGEEFHRRQGAEEAAGHQLGSAQIGAGHRRREEAPPLPPRHHRAGLQDQPPLPVVDVGGAAGGRGGVPGGALHHPRQEGHHHAQLARRIRGERA